MILALLIYSTWSELILFLVPFSVEPRPPLFFAWSPAWLCHLLSHLLMRFVSCSHYMSKILFCNFHGCRSFMNFLAGSTHFSTREFFHVIHVYNNGIHMRLEAGDGSRLFPGLGYGSYGDQLQRNSQPSPKGDSTGSHPSSPRARHRLLP